MIKINQNIISNDSKTYFIVDIAANFDGDIESKGLNIFSLENYQLILELMDRGFTGKHIKKNLFFYRRHESNLSDKTFGSIINYGNELARQYGLDFYTINQYHPYLNTEDIIKNINTIKHINYTKQ